MMPLLPPSEMLYSRRKSNDPYLPSVQRSPALCGSTQASVPSLTCQPGSTSLLLNECQPLVLVPSNRSFQPSFCSASESVFGAASSANSDRPEETSRTANRVAPK